MPRAGNNSANRAKAHLQWADRYNRYGDTQKAAAHFGRALEYDRRGGRARGQEFGGFEVDGHDIGLSREVIAGAAGAAVIAAGAVVPAATYIADKAAGAAYTMATKAKNYMFPKHTGKAAEGDSVSAGETPDQAPLAYDTSKTDEPEDSGGVQEQPRAYGVKTVPARAGSYNASDYKKGNGTGYSGNSTPSGSKTDEPWHASDGKTIDEAEDPTQDGRYEVKPEFGNTGNRRRRSN